MITVVNQHFCRSCSPYGGVVYIGRGTPLGNPFRMRGESDRNRVCDLYRTHLDDALRTGYPSICKEFNRLCELATKFDLYLKCHCAPRRCHGDYIKELIEERLSDASST